MASKPTIDPQAAVTCIQSLLTRYEESYAKLARRKTGTNLSPAVKANTMSAWEQDIQALKAGIYALGGAPKEYKE